MCNEKGKGICMNKENSLSRFLKNHKEKNGISFHMPGHKGSYIYEKYGYDWVWDNLPNIDITEIDGADNLFQAESVIKEIQEKYRRLYNVRKSYILINGSSCGIIASILATVPAGKKLLVARNCHKSIFSAISLGHIEPVYIEPDFEEEYKIMGGIDPEKVEDALKKDSNIKAIILPSPNYYGILSDVAKIKKIATKYNVVVIVDQAHGAHLRMMEDIVTKGNSKKIFPSKEKGNIEEGKKECDKNPLSGCSQGADIIINSTHKTLASFTQTAILNVNSESIDLYDLEEKLAWIQSTSPSYILMASLDINADVLINHGDELLEEWIENLNWFYKEAKKAGIKVIEEEKLSKSLKFDYTKINVDMGIHGKILEEELLSRNIFPELYTGNLLILMTGIGTRKIHLEKLLEALIEIKEKYKENVEIEKSNKVKDTKDERKTNKSEDTIDETKVKENSIGKKNEFVGLGKKKALIKIQESIGRVCGTSIIPYPPGIPLICPGEKISKDAVNYALELRKNGEKVIGITDEDKIAIYADIPKM